MPTIAESGVPGFDYNLWVGLFATGGDAGRYRRARSTGTCSAHLPTPEIKERLAKLGAEPMPMTPAEFKQFAHDEMDVGARIVKAAGIKGQ